MYSKYIDCFIIYRFIVLFLFVINRTAYGLFARSLALLRLALFHTCVLLLWLVLQTQIQRESQISRSDTIGESIGAQKGCVLIWNTRQLDIGPSLLIGTLNIEIGIGDAIGHTDIPWRRLAVQLGLQLLDHLLLTL